MTDAERESLIKKIARGMCLADFPDVPDMFDHQTGYARDCYMRNATLAITIAEPIILKDASKCYEEASIILAENMALRSEIKNLKRLIGG